MSDEALRKAARELFEYPRIVGKETEPEELYVPIDYVEELEQALRAALAAPEPAEPETMTDAALRKAAQRYVDARESLDMVNKRIHPQTWANLDEDADKALNDLRAALAAPAPVKRPCTCHPDDNPPVPCAEKYALADCKKAAKPTQEQEQVRAWAIESGVWRFPYKTVPNYRVDCARHEQLARFAALAYAAGRASKEQS